MMELIGLGCGEQDAVNPAAKDLGGPGIRALTIDRQNRSQRGLEIGNSGVAGIEGGECVDKHNLPVEAGKIMDEKGLHHVGHIRVVAPRHEREERGAARLDAWFDIEGREGEKGGARKVARHQKPARWQCRERHIIGAAAR